MPGHDVHRFGRQVPRLRRSDRQRRLAALPQVQRQAASVRTLPGRDHGEGRSGCPEQRRTRAASGRRRTRQAATPRKSPRVWTEPRGRLRNPARPDEAARPAPTGPELSPPPAAKTDQPAPLVGLPESKPPAELPPDLPAPVRLKPINPAKAGTYTSGQWRYQLQITSPGTRSEGRWGLADLRRPEVAAGRRQRLL